MQANKAFQIMTVNVEDTLTDIFELRFVKRKVTISGNVHKRIGHFSAPSERKHVECVIVLKQTDIL